MLDAIEKRVSRRSYTTEYLSNEEVKEVNEYIDTLNKVSNLYIELIEDASEAFSSIRTTYGFFKNVRSVVVLKGKKDDINLNEKIGYYGEDLVLKLTDMNLGTCWVGGTFDRTKFKVSNDQELVCVILVGKVSDVTLKEKLIKVAMPKNRKPISERLISDVKDLPAWVEEGMKAVILAPSARNTQKPIFTYKDGVVSADVVVDYVFDLVDLGIAKKHFELVAKGTFDLGQGGVFHQQ